MKKARVTQHLRMTPVADLAAADLLRIHWEDGGNFFNLRYFYNQKGSTFVFEHGKIFVTAPYWIFSDHWREYLHNQCQPQMSNLSTYRTENEQVSPERPCEVPPTDVTLAQLSTYQTDHKEISFEGLFDGWRREELEYSAVDVLQLMQYLSNTSVRAIIERYATR